MATTSVVRFLPPIITLIVPHDYLCIQYYDLHGLYTVEPKTFVNCKIFVDFMVFEGPMKIYCLDYVCNYVYAWTQGRLKLSISGRAQQDT